MKKVVIYFAVLVLLNAISSVEGYGKPPAGGDPRITFEQVEYDFGQVSEQGRKVSCDYVFRNTGDCPLVITRVITSCRCISTSHTRKPIPAGGEGMITVTYDPKKQNGVFRKAIQVHSNAPEGIHIVIVKGEVTP